MDDSSNKTLISKNKTKRNQKQNKNRKIKQNWDKKSQVNYRLGNLLSVTVPLSAFLRSINTRISQLERIPKGLQIKFSKRKQ